MGLDPAGNSLNNAMPRFQLSMTDAADLVAYIKKLGQTVDPGLTATSIRLGVILPPPSNAAKTGQVMHQAVQDYFTHLNDAGGIFSRRIELSTMELSADRAARGKAVRDFLSREKIFAVAAASVSGAEAEIASAAKTLAHSCWLGLPRSHKLLPPSTHMSSIWTAASRMNWRRWWTRRGAIPGHEKRRHSRRLR